MAPDVAALGVVGLILTLLAILVPLGFMFYVFVMLLLIQGNTKATKNELEGANATLKAIYHALTSRAS